MMSPPPDVIIHVWWPLVPVMYGLEWALLGFSVVFISLHPLILAYWVWVIGTALIAELRHLRR